jgi:hypothetical protein
MSLTENTDGNRFKVMVDYQPSMLDKYSSEALPRMLNTILYEIKEPYDGGSGSGGDWCDLDAWYESYDDAEFIYSMLCDLSDCMGVPLNPVLYNPADDEEEEAEAVN